MELALIFFNSFLVGFSGAMMPGPLLVVDIAETPRSGWTTGPIISIGHAIAEIAVVVVLFFGVTVISERSMATRVIGLVGGVALILMGLMMAYDIIRGRVNYRAESQTATARHKLAMKGIEATVSNPYWFVWWGTIGLALVVESSAHGWIGPTVFYFGHIMSDFVWYTFVSVLLWKGRRLIMGTGLKSLIMACALFLLYLGGHFVFKAFRGEAFHV